MAEQLRLMAVHAHPDDESSKGAATMARYVAEGVDVLVVTCTAASAAACSTRRWTGPRCWANIAEIRRAEMDRGPRDPRRRAGVARASSTPGCPRATRCRRCPRAASAWSTRRSRPAPLVRLMREFRPHVVTTYDEDGGYPHPDHIMCHKVSVAAFDAAGDPDRYPEPGEPWQPLKLYYHMGFSKAQDHGPARGDARRRASSRRTPSG